MVGEFYRTLTRASRWLRNNATSAPLALSRFFRRTLRVRGRGAYKSARSERSRSFPRSAIASSVRGINFELGLIQFCEGLMQPAHRARVVLVDRIGCKNENISALLAIRGQPFDTS